MILWGDFEQGLIPSEDERWQYGKEQRLALKCPYSDEGALHWDALLVLHLAGKAHQFLGWSGRVTPPQLDLALTACTEPCTPVHPMHTSLQLAAVLGAVGALRKQGAEQGNFTLTFDLHHRREGSSLSGSARSPGSPGRACEAGQGLHREMLPVPTESFFLHISLFHSQPSPNISQGNRSFCSVGEATQEQIIRGFTLPLFPTYYLHPYPHQGVMQVTWRDSPQGASWATSMASCKDMATALESQGVAAKGRRRMIPDPPPSCTTAEAFDLL